MKLTIRCFRFLPIFILLLMLTAGSSAITLDWGNLPTGQSWTAGALTGSFNTDATNPGNDITVTVANHGATWQTNQFPQNVATDPSFGSNIASDVNALHLGLNTFTNSTNTVSVTITFNYTLGVQNVSFNLIDIDSSTTFTDGIKSISATPVTGPANSVALNGLSNSTAVTTVTGSGSLGMTVVGLQAVGDHTGDVTFSTGSTPIKSITFSWYNPSTNYGTQVIALGNIIYTQAPEVGSGFGALALCGGLLVFSRLRRPSDGWAKA